MHARSAPACSPAPRRVLPAGSAIRCPDTETRRKPPRKFRILPNAIFAACYLPARKDRKWPKSSLAVSLAARSMLPPETDADFQESALSRKTSPRTIRAAIRMLSRKNRRAAADRDPPPGKQIQKRIPHPQEQSNALRKAPVDPLRYTDKTARDPNPPSALAGVPRTSRPRRTHSQPPAALPASTNPASSLEPSRKQAFRLAKESRSGAPTMPARRSALPQSNRFPAPATESPVQRKPAPATNNSS